MEGESGDSLDSFCTWTACACCKCGVAHNFGFAHAPLDFAMESNRSLNHIVYSSGPKEGKMNTVVTYR